MRAKQFTRRINEGTDESGVITTEVIKLISDGHTEVSPDVITAKVSAALGRPFMLKDLVSANNASPELQHYIDSINPSKIKFSTDILTVKNQDPVKTKEKAQSGVANMASRAASRPRLGESVSEGWNTGSDRVSLPDEPSTYWAGKGALQKEYEALYDQLVPAQGAAETIEGEVLRAASKIVYRHYNDGDEFNQASYGQLEQYIGKVSSYDDLAHKATEFALKANGNYTPNPDWDSLDAMDYGPEDDSDDYEEDDDYDDWSDDVDDEEDDEEDVYEDGASVKYGVYKRGGSIGERKGLIKTFDTKEEAQEYAKRQRRHLSPGERKYYKLGYTVKAVKPGEQVDEDLDEARADQVYTVNIVRRSSFGGDSRVRPTSGTLPELLEYFGYTLETGKSYERERGRYKINLNPKNIQSLVDNLNKAKSNAAANGHSNTYYEVADEQEVAEAKWFKTQYGWAGGRNEKTGGTYKHPDQIKADREAKKAQKQQKPVDEAYQDGADLISQWNIPQQEWAQFEEAVESVIAATESDEAWEHFWKAIEGDLQHLDRPVREAFERGLGSMDVSETTEYVLNGLRNGYESAGTEPRAALGLLTDIIEDGVRSLQRNGVVESDKEEFKSTYKKYYDKVKQQKEKTQEGWESGPEERPSRSRRGDPDDAYDAMRQEKADAEAEKAQAQRPQKKYYTLSGRGPNQEPNYEFPGEYDSQDAADAARAKLMADPKTPNPRDIGIRSRTRYLDEDSVTPLRDREDYEAKKKALQDIQSDPDTAKDKELSLAVMRRLAGLEQQRKDLK